MCKEISLRQKNKARIKLNVLDSMLLLLEDCSFEELKVSDICERAAVSRVTFYSYFPKKEDLLGYYVTVWCFKLAVNLFINPKRGKHALLCFFEEVVETPKVLILTIMRFLANGAYENYNKLSDAEKALMYPNKQYVFDIRILGLDEIFRKHISEAITDGELDPRTNPAETAIMLNSVLFGTVLSAHMYGITDVHSLYKKNLDMLYLGAKNIISTKDEEHD
ncbi:TetR/AcrR family transcriptional regulator [Clostridium sp. 'deep sea']|uniref:TetR/AcrR family transcriptional regulator n=1 Tax=Clostridium sp. 'deep sea' TaxID=2779445 RepID=UPI0018965506|nr:TetR/AcrR family transcriptional regulator [Clostridium sp. 'deep sea']QOR36316.1 TetR/AcrR family transcriptional regulator [Clostridium sp. 'deep sea']